MIYILLSFLITYIYPFGSDTIAEVTFGVTFLLNIGISLIMLPINIRLAGQLVMQVFKYRYICNHVATLDEDNKVMRGYYSHFRAVMCIIISMVGFNVFNIISEVLFLIKFFKWEWNEIWWYWWVAEGLCSAFEESIILYAVVMLYQIACYFQGQKFRFLKITIVIVLRFLYTSLQTGFVINFSMQFPMIFQYNNLTRFVIEIFELVPVIVILEFLLRFPMLFSFVRSSQRVVSKYINEFINDMNTDDLDRQHFVDKVLAGKLFQIAGWGTIFVSFMMSLVLVLQYTSMLVASRLLVNSIGLSTFISVLQPIAVTSFTLIQVFTILPSILYCIFLITLWLYFRNKSKVKYSGYSSDDQEILIRVHRPNKDVVLSNQDEFHDTYYKRKYTIMYSTYLLCIVVISVLFAGFFAPVLGNRWTWDISLRPGDYYLLDESILKSGCYNHQYELRFEPDPFQYSQQSLNCSEIIFAREITGNKTDYGTYTYEYIYHTVWLPESSISLQQINSTIDNHTDYIPSIFLNSKFPCYYPEDMFYNQLSKDSCKGAKLIENSDTNTCEYKPKCNTSQSGELNCTIMCDGMYAFHSTFNSQTITVKRFGIPINESDTTPLNEVVGEQLHEYDVIVFNSSTNTTDDYNTCFIHATCKFHLAFKILMPVLILLSSMLLLTIGLILILKI